MKKENVYMGTLIRPWMSNKNIKYITFSVTDDCNLMCSYCYFTHKTNKNKMSFEVAKKAIDYILSEKAFLLHDGVVWDFIGGEPTLEMGMIDRICDYILVRMYQLNHKWLYCYRIMIGTNGLLYDTEQFQKFLKKHNRNLHVNITVDGSKEKHDMSRIRKDGRGSYDDVVRVLPLWFKQTGHYSTKSTFSHNDLPYLKDSIINLWQLGFKNVMANVVFENVWQEGDDEIYESQLRQLADYIIENRIWNQVSVRFFSPMIGYPIDDKELKVNYCGSGNMMAIDYKGNFYPCIRFMESSLNNHKGRVIGNIETGIDTDKVRAFNALSTECESPQQCMDCDVSRGCSWCTGFNYDDSKEGTIFERKTYHCAMHKANVRANNYFWKRYEEETNFISPLRYNKYVNKSSKAKYLFILHNSSFAYCNVNSKREIKQFLSDELYAKALEICERYNYIPVHVGFSEQKEFGYYIGCVNSNYERNEMTIDVIESSEINGLKKTVSESVIFRISVDDFPQVKEDCEKLVNRGAKKISLVVVDYDMMTAQQLCSYGMVLNNLVDLVYLQWVSGNYLQIGAITDSLFLNKKQFCSAGRDLTLAPDGFIYPCQAFYFSNTGQLCSVEDFDSNYQKNDKFLSMCQKCEVNSCKKCFYLNSLTTEEVVVPFELHCVKTNLEHCASCRLLQRIEDTSLELPFDINTKIRCSDNLDPLISLRGETFITKRLNQIEQG